jgi:undecaprenyl-diphosphatase
MNLFQAIILSIIEGITEFLPVSSTGHMIIASSLMGISGQEFTKVFTVAIQLGAILSVVVLYWKRFFKTLDFYYTLFIAFLPVAVAGLLLKKTVDSLLGNVLIVAISLIIGGIILLFVDKWFAKTENNEDIPIKPKNALLIGLFQIIALIPGVSRSAATIIGGLTQGLNKKMAAEFAFFLAVPTMAAATLLELLQSIKKTPEIYTHENILYLILGTIIAFMVALIAIKSFIQYLTQHGFKVFGIYRIIVGVVIIVLIYVLKIPLQSI